MKAKLARLTVTLTVLASMALTAGAGIKWGSARTVEDFLTAFGF